MIAMILDIEFVNYIYNGINECIRVITTHT